MLFNLFNAFDLVESSRTSDISSPKRPIFLHACETCSELPSDISTMIPPVRNVYCHLFLHAETTSCMHAFILSYFKPCVEGEGDQTFIFFSVGHPQQKGLQGGEFSGRGCFMIF